MMLLRYSVGLKADIGIAITQMRNERASIRPIIG
jgi:hypothetical protein